MENVRVNDIRQDRYERFKRLAEARVIRTIKEIRLIGNLSNRANYAYEEKDVDKILRALEAEIKALRQRFYSGREQEVDFKL
jgi:hypothetical protein